MAIDMANIKPKDRDSLIQALRAGVVPKNGLHLIQVGRLNEVSAAAKDCDKINEGGTAFRLVIGEYGSGKTFYLHLARSIALEKKLVTMHADLNPDRRLQSTTGQARSLYAELMRNISTRNKPEGGATQSIVEKFVGQAASEAENSGKSSNEILDEKLHSLSELVNGFEFSSVIGQYLSAHKDGNAEKKNDVIRWLRGEFRTKSDAKTLLGVRTIIDDESFHDQLKLMSRFVHLAGYGGLFVSMDEMVNLYKLQSAQARNANYEQILRMLNDTLQGTSERLAIYFGGTPEFLFDTRRGLYGYEALRSRLSENQFAKNGFFDSSHPVIKLPPLTPDDFIHLLEKINALVGGESPLLNDDGIFLFADHCRKKIGDAYFRTPRTTITSFINLLTVLSENPDVGLPELIGTTKISADAETPENGTNDEDDEFGEFKI